ncbi:MAG: hypothetical protein GF346_11475, partial [Candidatus Eisenbacteria bacterium]|nr:hypothetical protein [Candidatus Latescibacterota bacterium]MBD3303056.1 hypothetical protein [Candidatus Eisenbacteria bacterium]
RRAATSSGRSLERRSGSGPPRPIRRAGRRGSAGRSGRSVPSRGSRRSPATVLGVRPASGRCRRSRCSPSGPRWSGSAGGRISGGIRSAPGCARRPVAFAGPSPRCRTSPIRGGRSGGRSRRPSRIATARRWSGFRDRPCGNTCCATVAIRPRSIGSWAGWSGRSGPGTPREARRRRRSWPALSRRRLRPPIASEDAVGRRRAVSALVLGILLVGTAAASPAGTRRDAERAFRDGVRFYEEERFADAWTCWRRVIDEGYLSSSLLLNLGNAAYRLGELGWAVYYYEYARRLDPADPDVASNLLLARSEAVGADASPGGSPVLRWFDSLQERITPAGATRLAAAGFWLLCLLWALHWLVPGGRTLRTAAWIGVGLFCVGLLVAGVKGIQQSIRPEAIAVAPIAARSEPDESASVELRLPAGSPVDLDRRAPGWREIVVSTSVRGWVPEEAVAAFGAPR